MSEVVESCKGDVDAWGIYGYYPIGLDNGNAGTSNQMAVAVNHSGAVPWTLSQIRNWTNSVYLGSTAATASKLMRTSSVLYKKEEAKRIVGIFYDTTLTSSVTTKLRDGQFGIYKNAPNITQIEPLYRSDFAVHPTILFVLVHPSNTPYNAGVFNFTSTAQAPILWKVDDRVAYKGVDFPNGVIFGIQVSGAPLAFGDACQDMIVNYSLDNFLRCSTTGTLYTNIYYFVMAYYTEEANAVEVPIRRISDDAQYRAYTTPDNYYFILDENYETNTWIPEDSLAQYGYYI